MRIRRFVVGVQLCFLVANAASGQRIADGSQQIARICRPLRSFSAPEAHQAVAVDEEHAYVVTNREIGKYDKRTGKAVQQWARKDAPLKHLNSAVVVDGKLYCAHSNWPSQPPANSVEIWDAASLQHLGRREVDGDGALNWIDRHNGSWWIVLAFYDRQGPRSVSGTKLVQLSDQWKPQASWRFPQSVLDRFAPHSNSGGSWGPDGHLYVTGHDRAELYALRIPRSGGTLELVGIVPAPMEGQGIAWDRSDIGVMWGIRRKSKQVAAARLSHEGEYRPLQRPVVWKRDPRNPILPPVESSRFDATRCMNPWVLRKDDEYHLYYSGSDRQGVQRICLATAPVDKLTQWKRHGPLLDNGAEGEFDARWCVLPHVVQFAPRRWHLYYTGNAGRGAGLSAFPGIGLAVSQDGKSWTKHAANPVLQRSGNPGDPDAVGMAGGSLLRVQQPGGGAQWRFYYTGCPTTGAPLALNQQKTICLAVSSDGVHWEKRGPMMLRDPDRDYEDIGVAGPVVHLSDDGLYRMWYSAIGTRWGFYSICYAESDDGYHWCRGRVSGDNLQLAPRGDGWERQMVEYPSVIREGDHWRLFYCGNGYGRTGIGTATGKP